MSEPHKPTISMVRDVLKTITTIAKHGSPAQFFAFLSALNFDHVFGDDEKYRRAKEIADRSALEAALEAGGDEDG